MAMDSPIPPTIVSFVIRFVVDASPPEGDPRPPYHGAIRHIQGEDEMNFSSWEDAVEFIRRYVPLETGGDQVHE